MIQMESTGIAGRVHISESTVGFLDGAYILEDGPPHKGIEVLASNYWPEHRKGVQMLFLAGMKTYFIKSRANETNANQNNDDSGEQIFSFQTNP